MLLDLPHTITDEEDSNSLFLRESQWKFETETWFKPKAVCLMMREQPD